MSSSATTRGTTSRANRFRFDFGQTRAGRVMLGTAGARVPPLSDSKRCSEATLRPDPGPGTTPDRPARMVGPKPGCCAVALVNTMHITSSVFVNDDEPGLHHDFGVWLE